MFGSAGSSETVVDGMMHVVLLLFFLAWAGESAWRVRVPTRGIEVSRVPADSGERNLADIVTKTMERLEARAVVRLEVRAEGKTLEVQSCKEA